MKSDSRNPNSTILSPQQIANLEKLIAKLEQEIVNHEEEIANLDKEIVALLKKKSLSLIKNLVLLQKSKRKRKVKGTPALKKTIFGASSASDSFFVMPSHLFMPIVMYQHVIVAKSCLFQRRKPNHTTIPMEKVIFLKNRILTTDEIVTVVLFSSSDGEVLEITLVFAVKRMLETFQRSKDASGSVYVEAIVFEVEDCEMVGGSAYGSQSTVCCTQNLAKLCVCSQGAVIRQSSTRKFSNWPYVFGVSFGNDDHVAILQPKSICDPTVKGLEMEDKTNWENSTDYLPGWMALLMNFYGFMFIAYLVLGIFWLSQNARFWREVLQLQDYRTLVITLPLWYFKYVEFNETDVRPIGSVISAVTFGNVRKTVEHVVLLIVSVGYGGVRPTLGGLTSKVILLGGTFFLASEVLELAENVGTINHLSGKARLFLVLPAARRDVFFLLWIFFSLSTTLNKLQARRIIAKLESYRKSTNVLAVAVIVSVGWICSKARRIMATLEIYRKFTDALAVAFIVTVGWIGYELYLKANDVYNELRNSASIIPAFWQGQVLSPLLSCVTCAL